MRATALVFLCLTLSGCPGDPPESVLGDVPAGTGPRVKFDLQAKPLPEIPLPIDVATRLDPRSPTGRFVNVSEIAPTFLESDTRVKIGTLDGFGTYAPITVSFDAPLDLVNIRTRHHGNEDPADDVAYLVDVTPGAASFGERVPLDVGQGNFPVAIEKRRNYFENDESWSESNLTLESVGEDVNGNGVLDPGEDVDSDGYLDLPNWIDPSIAPEKRVAPGYAATDPMCPDDPILAGEFGTYEQLATFYERETNTLIMRPVRPLRGGHTYAVVLTTRLVGVDGQPVRSPFAEARHHASQAEALKSLPAVLAPLGVSPAEVAFAWTFTTYTTTRELEWIRAGLYGSGPMAYLAEEFPVTGIYPVRVHSDDKRPFMAPHGELLKLIPLLLELFGGSPAGKVAVAADSESLGGLVMGTFDSPDFLVDRDGIAEPDYPADDDEVFQIDPATGQSVHGVGKVTWWCLLPERKEGDTKPFKTVIYGHGYGSNRLEALQFATRGLRMGLAVCGVDAFGHGLVLPQGTFDFGGTEYTYEALIQLVADTTTIGAFARELLNGRARDLDNDGVPDTGGDFWTSDIFHTRDVVRQTVVDHLQFVRLLRSFNGQRRWVYDTDGDGIGDLAGDFDGDGIVDVGGGTLGFDPEAKLTDAAGHAIPAVPLADDNYYIWGQSLGGIIAAIFAGLEPAIVAAAPVAGGAGLTDIAVRSRQGGVPEAVLLPLMGPFVVGNPAPDGGVRLKWMVNNVNNQSHHEFGTLEDAIPGDRIEVHDLRNGEMRWATVRSDRKFRIGIPADALSASERRPVLGLGRPDVTAPVLAEDPTLLGDPIEVRVLDGVSGRVKSVLDTFEIEVRFQGTIYAEGAPLVAISRGLGLKRNSPDLRRMMGISQMVLDSADPGTWAVHYEDPLDYSYDPAPTPGAAVLNIPTAGDMNVPVNTGIAISRAAGVISLAPGDPRFDGSPLQGYSQNRVLIDTYTVEAVECLPRYRNAAGEAVLFDIDDLDGGADVFGEPSLTTLYGLAPLRLTVPSVRAQRPGAGVGLQAMRIPMVERRGKHGFDGPDPAQPFDMGSYMNSLVYYYFWTDGSALPDDPCLEKSACTEAANGFELPFPQADWEKKTNW